MPRQVSSECLAAGGSSFKAQLEETGTQSGTEAGTPRSGDELSLLASAADVPAEKGQESKKKKKKAKDPTRGRAAAASS